MSDTSHVSHAMTTARINTNYFTNLLLLAVAGWNVARDSHVQFVDFQHSIRRF